MKTKITILGFVLLFFYGCNLNADKNNSNADTLTQDTTAAEEKLSFFMPNHQTSPQVEDGIVYFGSWKATFSAFEQGTGHLFAVDIQTGKELWKFKPKYDVGSTPVVSNGTLYFGNGQLTGFGNSPAGKKGRFYALDSKTGKEKWVFNTEGGINLEPTLDNNIIYFGCHDSYLYALDAETRTEKWKFKTGGPIVSTPIIADGVIYLGSDDGYLYAINKEAGQVKWKFYVEPNNQFSFLGGVLTPSISENMIYAVRHAGNYIYAVDKETGKELWKYPAEGELIPTTNSGGFQHSPAVSCYNKALISIRPPLKMVYIMAHDNVLIALDEKTGKQLWKIEPDGGDMHNSYPHIDNNNLYIANLESVYLYSFNAETGEKNWQFKNEGSIFSTPIVSDNLVFINSISGHLYAVDTQTGKLDFEFVPEQFTVSSFIQHDNISIFEKNNVVVKGLYGNNNYERYTPTLEEAKFADSIATKYVNENSQKGNNNKIENFEKYYKQCFGLLNEEGEKIILMVCYCAKFKNWRKQTYSAKGGGTCYTNLKVNLENGNCFDFEYNASK